MKLEDQVCNLDPAKRLKELGVKQESLFQWSNLAQSPIVTNFHGTREFPDSYWSAFTVAELGEMLKSLNGETETSWRPDGEYWSANMFWWNSDDHSEYFGSKCMQIKGSEADARAKMLIYLIENKLLPTPTNNK